MWNVLLERSMFLWGSGWDLNLPNVLQLFLPEKNG